MANGNGNGENWPAWAGKTVVNSGLVGLVLWWVAEFMIKPAQDDQRDFVKTIKITNEKQVEIAAKNADALSEMSRTQASILHVQEQIRDDQRRGAWNQSKAHNE